MQNQISKLKYDKNIAYLLNDDLFAPTEYKVMQAQTDVFIKCMKLLYNGKIQLFYVVDDSVAISDIVDKVDEEGFANIILNLLRSIKDVRSNGFLSINNIDLSFDSIFVDRQTYKVKVVYLPIYNDKKENFENTLINNLINLINNSHLKESLKIKRMIERIKMNGLSADSFNLKKEKYPEAQYVKQSIYGGLKLVSIDASVYTEFRVNSNQFVIGKNKELVDGVISYNNKVSRVHCKIIRSHNHYSIIDLNSLNGTFVNNVKLKSNYPMIIKNGDVIRLANSEFKVVVE